MRTLLSALLLALIPTVANGQIQAAAITTGSGLTATVGGATQSVPVGFDVTAGSTVVATGTPVAPPFGPTESSVTFSMTTGQPLLIASLTSSSNASSMDPATNISTDGDGEVTIFLSSAIPVDVEMVLTISRFFTTGMGCGAGDARFATGTTSRQASVDCLPNLFVVKPCSITIPTTLTNTATTVLLGADTFAIKSPLAGCFSASTVSRATLVVRPVARSTPYGAQCGAGLSSVAVLQDPTREMLLIDGPPDAFVALLLIGTTQTSVPFFGCEVLVGNIIADAALPLDMQGDFGLNVPLPPPGLLTLQVATTNGSSLQFSNGLQF